MNQNKYVSDIVSILSRIGQTRDQIGKVLLDLETLVLTRLTEDYWQKLSPNEQRRFSELMDSGTGIESLADFLHLDPNQLNEDIGQKIKQLRDELAIKYDQHDSF